jgi:hypothetical protein
MVEMDGMSRALMDSARYGTIANQRVWEVNTEQRRGSFPL